jgi:predicted lipid-binding transport protein (Tim44 family)
MNAVLVPDEKASTFANYTVEQSADTTAATAPPVTTPPAEQWQPISFGAAQARVLPLALLTVFAISTGAIYRFQGDLAGSIGLGLYLAMWLGGGFGFLGGGILWAIDEMEAGNAH